MKVNTIACAVIGLYHGYSQYITLKSVSFDGLVNYRVCDNHLSINRSFDTYEAARNYYNSLCISNDDYL